MNEKGPINNKNQKLNALNLMDFLELLPDTRGNGFSWERLRTSFPFLQELEKTPQDPFHHGEGDAGIHTRMVCEELLQSARWGQTSTTEERLVLFYAALFHDIAKATCTREDQGKIISAGHSARGAVDTRIALWRAGIAFPIRERIARIVAHHQVPFHAFGTNRAGLTPEFLVRKLSWELNIDELTTVAEADIRGRKAQDIAKVLDDIELFRELAKEEQCLQGPRSFPDEHTRWMYCRKQGDLFLDAPFFQHDLGSSVIVMCGLPASGKNTWVAQNAPNLPVVSFDDAREELGLKHGQNEGAAAHRAIDKAKSLLRERAPFVWNATHLSRNMRDKTLDLLAAYKANIRMVYIPEKVLLQRNNTRDTSLSNAGILKMLNKWEVPMEWEAHSLEIHAGSSKPLKKAKLEGPSSVF